jgi:hypothetical protein
MKKLVWMELVFLPIVYPRINFGLGIWGSGDEVMCKKVVKVRAADERV